MRTAQAFSQLHHTDTLQAKADAAQASVFSGLAGHFAPLTQEAIDLALEQARAAFTLNAEYLEAQAAMLEAEVAALAAIIRETHISQRLRDFVHKT